MDDELMTKLLLMTTIMEPDLFRLLLNETFTPSCDLCKISPNDNNLTSCIFCNKSFCRSCCGKEKTRICKNCNFTIANSVNERNLKTFSVKELRIITDNYNVSLENVFEKSQIIEAILSNFKKSIMSNTEETVNVSELKERMDNLNLEEKVAKEQLMAQERNQSKMFSDYSNIPKETKNISFDLNNSETLNVTEEEIRHMSIRQLKELLDRFKTDYSGILEKKELVSLTINLCQAYNQYKRHGQESDTLPTNRELECRICMDNLINCVFMDCGHSMCCFDCGSQLVYCPMCRRDVIKCFKIIIG